MQEKNISIIGRQESPVKTVLRLSLPAILEQIMFTAVTYVDTAMVGVLVRRQQRQWESTLLCLADRRYTQRHGRRLFGPDCPASRRQ